MHLIMKFIKNNNFNIIVNTWEEMHCLKPPLNWILQFGQSFHSSRQRDHSIRWRFEPASSSSGFLYPETG